MLVNIIFGADSGVSFFLSPLVLILSSVCATHSNDLAIYVLMLLC